MNICNGLLIFSEAISQPYCLLWHIFFNCTAYILLLDIEISSVPSPIQHLEIQLLCYWIVFVSLPSWVCLHFAVWLVVCSIMPVLPERGFIFAQRMQSTGEATSSFTKEKTSTHTHTQKGSLQSPVSMMTNHTGFCQRHSDGKKHLLKMHGQHAHCIKRSAAFLKFVAEHFWGFDWSQFSFLLTATDCHSYLKLKTFWYCHNSCDNLLVPVSLISKDHPRRFKYSTTVLHDFHSNLWCTVCYPEFICLSGSADTLHNRSEC